MQVNVRYFFRYPKPGFFSIEELFGVISNSLPFTISHDKIFVSSKGASIVSILKNIVNARLMQSEVNHITGDINYITLGMKPNRTMLTIHDIESLVRPSKIKNWLIHLFWLQLPVKQAKFITVISEASRNKLLDKVTVDPSKVIIIYNPVSPYFKYTPANFNTALPRILHLGTKENKNLDRLIQSLTNISCHLRIIGKLKEHQFELLNKYKIDYSSDINLTFEDIIKEYQLADFVSFVSLYEGFGMPIIEAQATGRPVLTSNCSSMPEVAGEGALLVDPTSVEEIRAGILRLIIDEALRNSLIQKGLENVKRFDAKAIAAQYAALYRKIAEENA
jgi:glycosyltransferase involved in cell wall biosynthesis